MTKKVFKMTVFDVDGHMAACLIIPVEFKTESNPLLENNQYQVRWELLESESDSV